MIRMDDDIGSLQPWQIYSSLYFVFWCVAVYFDHFLLTFVFCIAFGVISELATKYMNGEQFSNKKVIQGLLAEFLETLQFRCLRFTTLVKDE